MATTYYCYHGGNNTDGLSWANAKTTLDAAHALCAAGDMLMIASDHAETLGGTTTLSEGSAGNPIQAMSANRGTNALETMVAGGGLITCGSNRLDFTSPCAYYFGLNITTANTGNAIQIATASTAHAIKFESCKLVATSSGSSVRMPLIGSVSGTDDTYVEFLNCTFKYGGTSSKLTTSGSRVVMIGCSVDPTGSIPTTWLLPQNAGSCQFSARDCDLSALSGALVDASIAIYSKYIFSHCKLHSSATPTTGTIPGYGGVEVAVEACDSADTYIRSSKTAYAGTLVTDTAQYRTGGASAPSSDGTDPQPYSWKVTTNSGCNFVFPFALPPIYQFYNGVIDGTTKTVTVCYTQDNATNLTNAEIWMTVEYMATDGSVLGTVEYGDKMDDVMDTPVAQDDDTSVWALDGSMTNENPQKMVATIAPREKGYIVVRIFVGKASISATPVYIDPLVVVS